MAANPFGRFAFGGGAGEAGMGDGSSGRNGSGSGSGSGTGGSRAAAAAAAAGALAAKRKRERQQQRLDQHVVVRRPAGDAEGDEEVHVSRRQRTLLESRPVASSSAQAHSSSSSSSSASTATTNAAPTPSQAELKGVSRLRGENKEEEIEDMIDKWHGQIVAPGFTGERRRFQCFVAVLLSSQTQQAIIGKALQTLNDLADERRRQKREEEKGTDVATAITVTAATAAVAAAAAASGAAARSAAAVAVGEAEDKADNEVDNEDDAGSQSSEDTAATEDPRASPVVPGPPKEEDEERIGFTPKDAVELGEKGISDHIQFVHYNKAKARHLYRACTMLIRNFRYSGSAEDLGGVPERIAQLTSLPGIGESLGQCLVHANNRRAVREWEERQRQLAREAAEAPSPEPEPCTADPRPRSEAHARRDIEILLTKRPMDGSVDIDLVADGEVDVDLVDLVDG